MVVCEDAELQQRQACYGEQRHMEDLEYLGNIMEPLFVDDLPTASIFQDQ